jgi:hypothetical protein
MAEQLFLFMQMEFPWELGPADGRYVVRGGDSGGPEHVIVLDTVTARRRRARGPQLRRPEAKSDPAAVPTTRATVIDPVPVSAEGQARRWLDDLDVGRDVGAALAVLNRVLFVHRIAAADAYLRELSAAQALVIRAGWGIGEQVAGGRWRHARELPWDDAKVNRRAAALRPQERLAVLLGAREEPLVCEEHALRARVDLDQGRLAHTAIELGAAYAAALNELDSTARPDLALRVQELRELREGVARATRAALPEPFDGPELDRELDEQLLRHALERLEAALRARTAVGWQGPR